MKFAHLADVHLGAWCREPLLHELNLKAFKYAIDKCISEPVDFVLIAGDLFDSALPSIEILKEATAELKRLKDKDINCYIVPGSHDYSISGKSFIDVLEKAGLCRNVTQAVEEKDFFIAGIQGKKAGLERDLFKDLSFDLEKHKDKMKIFMLHTTLSQTPLAEFVESVKLDELPAGFDYYAAGHIHEVIELEKDNKRIIYAGPLFPNNFVELEKIKYGNFYIIETNGNLVCKQNLVKLKEILPLNVDVEGMSPTDAFQKISHEISAAEVKDKITLLRICGCVRGKISDIGLDKLNTELEASVLLKNISDLTSSELDVKLEIEAESVDEIEKEIVKKCIMEQEANGRASEFDSLTEQILKNLDIEKQEGEQTRVFEDRIFESAMKIFNLKKMLIKETEKHDGAK